MNRLIIIYTTLLLAPVAASVAFSAPVIESQRLRVELREDLNGFSAITDRQTGRNYAAKPKKPQGLYQLRLGSKPGSVANITSLDATRRKSQAIANGFEFHFEHTGKTPLTVICRATAGPQDPMIRWSIKVVNNGKRPLSAIAFPLAACVTKLDSDFSDDAILYPAREGTLLTKPHGEFREGVEFGFKYPGEASAQFMYFFDPKGGLYMAAEDGAGHPKTPAIAREGKSLVFKIESMQPGELAAAVEVPYEVVWTAGGGRWEDGAEIYRQWAAKQPWCARKIRESSIPAWLHQSNVFLNFRVDSSAFDTVDAADQTFKKYRDFFGLPIVACAFGWEKNGDWIGPDYFPPVNGESYYIDLARRLKERGDHMQVFTSGFRWAVKAPVKNAKAGQRVYTDYDGTAKFMREGKAAAAINAQGRMILDQPAWADNYILCVGSAEAQKILADCFWHVFDWGVAGVDLDQNIGGEVDDCYNPAHGHPVGAGVWQYQAMSGFLKMVQQRAKAKHPDSFIGVEEPCEAYIPWMDVYHGRIFTDTHWPVSGPGRMAVPLYIYLYHEYQPGYAGWIDTGFSPFGIEKYGLGRAFIFGMYPGVRIPSGKMFDLSQPQISDELKMLRGIARLQEWQKDSLLLGRMLPAPAVKGSPMIKPPTGSDQQEVRRGDTGEAQKRGELPMPWPVVQATAWQSVDGQTVCYAIANLSDKPQKVKLELVGAGGREVVLERRGYSLDEEISETVKVKLPMELSLSLKPWEVAAISQR